MPQRGVRNPSTRDLSRQVFAGRIGGARAGDGRISHWIYTRVQYTVTDGALLGGTSGAAFGSAEYRAFAD